PFDRIVERLVIHSARLSQDELWERLERQRERGQLAEEKVVELEQFRLLSANRADLAAKVQRISIEDVSVGFDVRSFETDESPRFIEVKSSVGSQIIFEWSEGERTKARQEGAAFCIYFVPFSYSLPILTSPVVIIRNPIAHISAGALVEVPSNYKVMEDKRTGALYTAESKIKKSLLSDKFVIFG
ncbi:MAG TPA: DUF3883 domain-containing protein, partial [Candidatus Angelobacter sp.]|nr:DUF3883 domain-containing protein [Candidatus Angelobacter sp.]